MSSVPGGPPPGFQAQQEAQRRAAETARRAQENARLAEQAGVRARESARRHEPPRPTRPAEGYLDDHGETTQPLVPGLSTTSATHVPLGVRKRGPFRRSAVEGVARGVQTGDPKKITFRLERRDQLGNRVAPISVRVDHGLRGSVGDGEHLRVEGRFKHGLLDARRVTSLSSGLVLGRARRPWLPYAAAAAAAAVAMIAVVALGGSDDDGDDAEGAQPADRHGELCPTASECADNFLRLWRDGDAGTLQDIAWQNTGNALAGHQSSDTWQPLLSGGSCSNERTTAPGRPDVDVVACSYTNGSEVMTLLVQLTDYAGSDYNATIWTVSFTPAGGAESNVDGQ